MVRSQASRQRSRLAVAGGGASGGGKGSNNHYGPPSNAYNPNPQKSAYGQQQLGYMNTVTGFNCPHCHKSFGDTTALENHVVSKHEQQQTGNDALRCPFCNKQASSVSALRSHISAKHGGHPNVIAEAASMPTYDSTLGGVPCYLCTKVFKSQAALTDHVEQKV
jgi:uncharacterized C2H2 Zn-finger protein